MKPMIKVFLLDDKGEKFFGEGPYRLLKAVQETGSLKAAAESMFMAYTKAIKILKQAEAAMNCQLTEKAIGGKNGGGSRLTEEGKELLRKYEVYRERCIKTNCDIYNEIFGFDKKASSDSDGEPQGGEEHSF